MFYIYIVAAVLLYSLHNTFIATIYREEPDRLLVIFYRALAIALSCSFILLQVPQSDFVKVYEQIPSLLLASTLAFIGVYAAITAINYLPVGITNTLLTAICNIVTVTISVLIVGEVLSTYQLMIIAAASVAITIFGLGPATGALPKSYNPQKGFLFCLVFALLVGISYVLLAQASRSSNAFLCGYLWESFIALNAGTVLIARSIFCKIKKFSQPKLSISLLRFRHLLLCSMPAGLGTICYTLAMTTGSIAIASSCLNLVMVATVIGGVIVHKERLANFQWLLLFLICSLTIALRLLS